MNLFQLVPCSTLLGSAVEGKARVQEKHDLFGAISCGRQSIGLAPGLCWRTFTRQNLWRCVRRSNRAPWQMRCRGSFLILDSASRAVGNLACNSVFYQLPSAPGSRWFSTSGGFLQPPKAGGDGRVSRQRASALDSGGQELIGRLWTSGNHAVATFAGGEPFTGFI